MVKTETDVITAILYVLSVVAISWIAGIVISALLELEDAPWR